MAVLVIGGAGYIGSHAAHFLRRKGYDVIIYDNLSTGHRELAEGFELVVGDIADTAKITKVLQRCDSVMHFAAYAYVGESVQNPKKYFHNNVTSGIALLDAVIESRVRKFIFSSTCATYGDPVRVPITESNPQQPINPYGMTKLAFENALAAYGRAYGLKYVTFRYFNAAGADENGTVGEKHEPETHLIPLIFDAAQGKRAALEIFGDDYPTVDGSCIRDYIHVTDLAEAHLLGLEYLTKGDSIAMNLGTGKGYSVKEVVAAAERITGHTVPTHIGPRRPGDPPELVADPSLAEKVLKWKAKYSLDEIIATAWKWAQKNSS
ncbi:MAG TPA: UDP-glucose 4-epimerase GalE [Terriglobales bacterium]|nr:UDP-glucose 4-epimerase GalE [Terriglobales bacterium]